MNQPPNYHQIAAVALAKCAAYDPWFPKASQAIVDSWAEQIKHYKLGPADVLAGVKKMYSEHGSGFRPLPKDLTDAARAERRERDAQTGPTPEYQQLCESKSADTAALANITRRTGITVGKPVGQ